MNTIGDNIKYLRKLKGLTQDDLAKETGITRAAIGSYEEGRAVPKLDSLQNIARYFNLSLDQIVDASLSKEGSPGSIHAGGENLRILSTVVDPGNKELVALVPARASAGYTAGYGDPAYIEKLSVFSLPFPELSQEKTYRVFQINGDSMEPLKSGTYIICEYTLDREEIKEGGAYIVVTRNDGIVFKRIYNIKNEKITLTSDNPAYQPYQVEKTEILEIWKALGYVSFEMSGHNDTVTLNKLYELILDLQKNVSGG